MDKNLKYVTITIILVTVAVSIVILIYQYLWLPKKESVKLPEKLSCESPEIVGYRVENEFFVDFNNDGQDELIRVYTQDYDQNDQNITSNCERRLPVVIKIFSKTSACYKNEFVYPTKLTPIAIDNGLNDERFNSADAQLMKNFWGDGRNVVFVSATLNFCGSGTRNKLLFFSYQDGKYIKVDGPIFSELDYYFLSSPPKGKKILIARGKWETQEAHFDPHRYTFILYQWNGQKYEEIEIGTTKNKYLIDDENFMTILRNLERIFQNEPEKLQLEIKKL